MANESERLEKLELDFYEFKTLVSGGIESIAEAVQKVIDASETPDATLQTISSELNALKDSLNPTSAQSGGKKRSTKKRATKKKAAPKKK